MTEIMAKKSMNTIIPNKTNFKPKNRLKTPTKRNNSICIRQIGVLAISKKKIVMIKAAILLMMIYY